MALFVHYMNLFSIIRTRRWAIINFTIIIIIFFPSTVHKTTVIREDGTWIKDGRPRTGSQNRNSQGHKNQVRIHLRCQKYSILSMPIQGLIFMAFF